MRAQLETDNGFDQAMWDEMVALGWTGIALPESCGGSGLGVATVVPVVEAMGRAMLGTPLISTTLAGQLLLRAGNSEQSERCCLQLPRCPGDPGAAGKWRLGRWKRCALE